MTLLVFPLCSVQVNAVTIKLYSVALELIGYFNDNDLTYSGIAKIETLTALNPLPLGFQMRILPGTIIDS